MDKRIIGANVACLANYSLSEAVNKIKEMGFGTIGLLAFAGLRHSIGDVPGFWYDDLTEEECDCLKDSLQGFEHISIHAPFADLPLFTYNEGVRREAMRQIKEAIEATWFFGGEVVTVHANRKTFFQLEEYWEEMATTFRELGDFAEGCGVKLGIETGFPNTVKDYTTLFLEIDHEAVGATIDVGHIVPYIQKEVLESKEGPERYNQVLMSIVRTLGSKIYHLHLHDVRRQDWRDHRCVGRGMIDFDQLFGFLKEINYQGLVELELEEEDQEACLFESKRYIETIFKRHSQS